MGNEDSGSVRGRGAKEMIPPRGNPFDRAMDAVPMGGERRSLMLGGEPRDLSPDDLAAMTPSSHAERDLGPAAPAGVAVPPGALDDADAAAIEPSSHAQRDAALGGSAGLMPTEDLAALEPSSHAERDPEAMALAGGSDAGTVVPPGAAVLPDVPTTAPGQAIPDRTVTGGVVLRGVQAFVEKPLELSENVGIGAQAYDLGENLPGNPDLVNILVPDGRLTTIWLDIDSVEQQVSTTRGVSLKVAREMLDRLAKARNFLLADRANYEEAGRQLAEVKYRLTRIKNSRPSEHSRAILLYLIVVGLLVFLGFAVTTSISGALSTAINAGQSAFDFSLVWQAMLWGAVGGLTGASYGLWVHVARDQDYEPQYALWYYTNPPMGFILGAFMYIVAQLIMPVLVVAGQGQTGSATDISPYVLYFLCWAVGFQQNLAFSIANSVLKRIIPADEKADDSKAKKEGTTPGSPPAPGSTPEAAGQNTPALAGRPK